MKKLFIIIGLMIFGLTSIYSNENKVLSEKVYTNDSESYETHVGLYDSENGYFILQYCFIDCVNNKSVKLVLISENSSVLFVIKSQLDIVVEYIDDYNVFLNLVGSIGEYSDIKNYDDGFQMITFTKSI